MKSVFEVVRLVCFVVPFCLIIWRIFVKYVILPKKTNMVMEKQHIQDEIIVVTLLIFVILNIANAVSKNYFTPYSFIENIKDLLTNSQFTEEEKLGGVSDEYVPREQASPSTPITEDKPKEESAPSQPSIFSTNITWALKDTTVKVSNYNKENSYKYYLSSSDSELKDGKWLDMKDGSALIEKDGINYLYVKAIRDSKESNISSPLTVMIDNDNPTKPEIIGGSGSFTTTSRTIKLKDPSVAKSGIKLYEYYVSKKSNSLTGGFWKLLENNEVTLSSIGSFYVYVRSVSNVGLYSPISNYEPVNIKEEEVPKPTDQTPTPTPTVTAPEKPVIGKKYKGWISIENTITVDTTLAGKVPVDHYEYYISTSNTVLTNGSWTRMSGNSFKYKKDGIYYVFVKAVGSNNTDSKLSDPLEIWFDLNKPTTPTITGGSDVMATSRTISVSTESTSKSGINSYEYYISTSATSQTGGSWIEISGKSIIIQTKGTNYVFFRGVSWSWMISDPSNAQKVVIGTPTSPTTPTTPTTPETPTPVTPPSTTDSVDVTSYGAKGSDSLDDTQAFKNALNSGKKVYVPTGTYHLQWKNPEGYIAYPTNGLLGTVAPTSNINITTLVGKIYGPGLIVVDKWEKHFPNNRDSAYDNAYGKFYANDVNDELWMSMNLTHEASSKNLNVYQQRWNGIKGKRRIGSTETYSNGTSGINNILNSWGQIVLRIDKTVTTSEKVNLYIGAQGLLGYNEYTKNWDILINGMGGISGNGGLWPYDFATESAEGDFQETISGKFNKITVDSKKFNTLCYHFWSQNKVTISDSNKYKWFIAFYDSYTDSNFATEYLVGLPGSDVRTTLSSGSVPAYMNGKYSKLTKTVRRNYTHNMFLENYHNLVPSKAAIDKLIDMNYYGKIMISN